MHLELNEMRHDDALANPLKRIQFPPGAPLLPSRSTLL
jgi:hypothetical protein